MSMENEGKIFDGLRPAKLGTEKNPAQVRVDSSAREAEVRAVCEKHGWACLITVDSEQPEDLGDLERLRNPPSPAVSDSRTGRNDPCPCGSGKKFKKCCAS